jgi:hypothetical protein
MTRRSRILSFGSAALLVVAGAVSVAILGGTVGQVLAIALISLGFVLATGLVFLEVGLSEDRERARAELEGTHEEPPPPRSHATPSHPLPTRLPRMRGSRRRLG